MYLVRYNTSLLLSIRCDIKYVEIEQGQFGRWSILVWISPEIIQFGNVTVPSLRRFHLKSQFCRNVCTFNALDRAHFWPSFSTNWSFNLCVCVCSFSDDVMLLVPRAVDMHTIQCAVFLKHLRRQFVCVLYDGEHCVNEFRRLYSHWMTARMKQMNVTWSNMHDDSQTTKTRNILGKKPSVWLWSQWNYLFYTLVQAMKRIG